MTSDSHLYPGFRFAGALASVSAQRRLQRDALAALSVRHLLSVGCGYGDELEVMLEGQKENKNALRVLAIDLADVGGEAGTLPNVAGLGERFRFRRLGLLEAEAIAEFGSFDVAQCGFVLHDVKPEDKGYAIARLARAIRPGGYLLVSDIFLSEGGGAREIGSIYDLFMAEAREALEARRLNRTQFDALTGDGARPGLIRSRRDAMRGMRDHFEKPSALVHRARQAGLVLQRVLTNPRSGRLLVMLFHRPPDVRRGADPMKGNGHGL